MIYHGYELDLANHAMKEHHHRAAREKQIEEIKAAGRERFSLGHKLVNFLRRSSLKESYIPLHPSEKK